MTTNMEYRIIAFANEYIMDDEPRKMIVLDGLLEQARNRDDVDWGRIDGDRFFRLMTNFLKMMEKEDP